MFFLNKRLKSLKNEKKEKDSENNKNEENPFFLQLTFLIKFLENFKSNQSLH